MLQWHYKIMCYLILLYLYKMRLYTSSLCLKWLHMNLHSSAAHLDSYLPGIHCTGFRCGPAGWSGVWDGHSGGQNTVVSIMYWINKAHRYYCKLKVLYNETRGLSSFTTSAQKCAIFLWQSKFNRFWFYFVSLGIFVEKCDSC